MNHDLDVLITNYQAAALEIRVIRNASGNGLAIEDPIAITTLGKGRNLDLGPMVPAPAAPAGN